jgi:hypothetical protein
LNEEPSWDQCAALSRRHRPTRTMIDANWNTALVQRSTPLTELVLEWKVLLTGLEDCATTLLGWLYLGSTDSAASPHLRLHTFLPMYVQTTRSCNARATMPPGKPTRCASDRMPRLGVDGIEMATWRRCHWWRLPSSLSARPASLDETRYALSFLLPYVPYSRLGEL